MRRIPAAEEKQTAIVESFDRTFGRVRLEDGRTLSFDIVAWAGFLGEQPTVGERVWIAIDRSPTTQRERVWYMLPVPRPLVLPYREPIPPLSELLDLLHAAGLVRGFDLDAAQAVLDEDDSIALDTPEDVIRLIDRLYSSTGADECDAGAADGWYAIHEWRYRKSTDDPVADLTKRVGRPLLTLVSFGGDETARVRDVAGVEWVIESEWVGAFVVEYNDELAAHGDPRRFEAGASELTCWILLTENQKRQLAPLRLFSE